MPPGLKNNPRKLMNSNRCDNCLCALELPSVLLIDTVLFSKTLQDCIADIRRVLWLRFKVGITLKLKKSMFYAETIDYFSHVVRPGRLALWLHTSDVVAKLNPFPTQTVIRSLLGLYNVLSRFVPSFVHQVEAFIKTLKNNQPKYFRYKEQEERAAVVSLKRRF